MEQAWATDEPKADAVQLTPPSFLYPPKSTEQTVPLCYGHDFVFPSFASLPPICCLDKANGQGRDKVTRKPSSMCQIDLLYLDKPAVNSKSYHLKYQNLNGDE